MTSRDAYIAAAFSARLSRGEAVESAAQGALQDAEVMARARASEEGRKALERHQRDRERWKRQLKAAGWTTSDGARWTSPSGKEMSFSEAAARRFLDDLYRGPL